MRRPAAFFSVVLALGAIILAHRGSARAQDAREEGPSEIEKCQTIDKPGSYKLVTNLTAGVNADCLVITTTFVTVDLAGFTITGGGGTEGVGITGPAPSSSQQQGIAVRNGSISGFGNAVDLRNTDGSIVEGLRVFGTSTSPFVETDGISANGIVRGNTATGFTSGIDATGVVTGNYAVANRIGLFVGAGSTVIGNTANSNIRVGILVNCPSNVTNNTAIGNNVSNLALVGDGCNNTNNVAP